MPFFAIESANCIDLFFGRQLLYTENCFVYSCSGGYIQLMSGAEVVQSASYNRVCGSNERYSPPVVLFSDGDAATLLFQ